MRSDLVERLFAATAHGDEDHRAWLLEAYTAFFADRPVPAPRGKGNKEAEIERLREALGMIDRELERAESYHSALALAENIKLITDAALTEGRK